MSDTNGSCDPKPWWRTRRAHSAPGPGGRVLLYCKDLTIDSPLTGAHLLDRVTLGFRSGSFTAILDPSGSRTRAFFLAAAGLRPPSAGSIDLRAAGGGDRPASVGLLTASTPLDESLSVSENLLSPLSLTGTSALADHVGRALALTSLEGLADARACELSPLDRFRALSARALVSGGDLILVEDPDHLPTAPDRRAALELLRSLAQHGTTVILASTSPESCALADRTVLLTNGRVTYDLLAPGAERLRTILTGTDEDPATLLGPIPAAVPPAAPPAVVEDAPVTGSPGTEEDPSEAFRVSWIPIRRSGEAEAGHAVAEEAAAEVADPPEVEKETEDEGEAGHETAVEAQSPIGAAAAARPGIRPAAPSPAPAEPVPGPALATPATRERRRIEE
ncbi:MAG: hypothetical protein MR805_09940, partial [Schaalia hyovaginalis]|nr:hypothetical protein [Schaalia hyovaginalis]